MFMPGDLGVVFEVLFEAQETNLKEVVAQPGDHESQKEIRGKGDEAAEHHMEWVLADTKMRN